VGDQKVRPRRLRAAASGASGRPPASRPPTSRIVGSTLGWFAALDAALQRDGSDVPEVQDFHEHYLLAQRSMKQLAAGP
jgi:hypothetical protein